MDIEVMGPLHVRLAGTSLVPSAGKPRQLLALLALRSGHIVPIPTLMEELWGEHIPRSAQTTLQTYVMQLRRLIRKALPAGSPLTAKDVLITRFGSYQLGAEPGRSDMAQFHEKAAAGALALERGAPAEASALLREALDMWRGPALADVPAGRILDIEILAMNEARTRALELCLSADLRTGRHGEILAELVTVAAHNPLSENIWALLMTALHRSGHTWRALEAFQQLRGTLMRELGVEPCTRIQRLHQEILSSGRDDERSAA
ncbi:BTAD domain-containing putative transcriptional regulator [Streptomyces sp. NPDC014676]|uniref:AfsR/SARP family transcriptional regulator n=1 Tax=Streptomyces sp. NPDC014676 TaxID=3364879 RepID=UPI0036F68577